MAIEIISQNDGSRIDHPAYKDIYNVTYAKGVITEFETEETDESESSGPRQLGEAIMIPFIAWEFTDRVKLDISDGEWIPLFYHCKLHCYDEDVASLRDNGALNGSAYAFQIGDEVKVLLEEDVPKYVIGPCDGKPRMGAQYFKFSFTNDPLYSYSNPIIEEETVDETPTDYYGDEPNCDQLGERISISTAEIRDPYNPQYMSNWYYISYLVKVGPVLYVFWMRTTVYPPPFSDIPVAECDLRVFSGVWTESLESDCKAASATSLWNLGRDSTSSYYVVNPPISTAGYEIYDIENSLPPEMKEQRYYSEFEEREARTFGLFWAGLNGYYFHDRLLDFSGVQIEGQSYYEKE